MNIYKQFGKVISCFVFILLLSGCQNIFISNSEDNNEQNIQDDDLSFASGMEVDLEKIEDGDASGNLVYSVIDSDKLTIEIQESDPPKAMRDWCADEDNLLVINGGYFMEDYRPTGLLITDEGQSSRSYVDKTKGMFFVDQLGNPGITNLAIGVENHGQYKYALQTFPVLMENSESVVEKEGELAKRSFVAIDETGSLILGNTSGIAMDLKSFGEFLANSDLTIKTALNLDGGSSSGFCIRDSSGKFIYEDYSLSLIPHVIVVKEQGTR